MFIVLKQSLAFFFFQFSDKKVSSFSPANLEYSVIATTKISVSWVSSQHPAGGEWHARETEVGFFLETSLEMSPRI